MAVITSIAVDLEARMGKFVGDMENARKQVEQFGYSGRQAAALYQSLRTPAEAYADQVRKIDGLLAKGKISQELYNRALEDAKEKFEHAGHSAEHAHGMFSEVFKAEALIEGVKMAGEMIAELGEKAIEAGKELAEFVQESMESITETSHLAEALGESVETLSQFQHAAALTHVSGEEVANALSRMEKSLGAAAVKGGEVSDTFAQFGIDLKKIAEESPVKAFGDLSDALLKVENHSTRVYLASELFGKGFKTILPLMEQGSAGIRSMSEDADRLGRSFTKVEAEQVVKASRAMAELKEIVAAVGVRLAVQLAPYIESAGQKLAELATRGSGIGAKVAMGVEITTKAVGYLADVFQFVADRAMDMEVGVLHAMQMTVHSTVGMLETLRPLAKVMMLDPAAIDAMGQASQGFDQFVEMMESGQEKMNAAPWAHEKIDAFFKSVREGAAATEKAINESVRPAGQPEAMPEPINFTGDWRKSAEEAQAYATRLHDQLAAKTDGSTAELAKLENAFEALGHVIADNGRKIPLAQYRSLMDDFRSLARSIGDVKKSLNELHDQKVSLSLDTLDAQIADLKAKLNGVPASAKALQDFIKNLNPSGEQIELFKQKQSEKDAVESQIKAMEEGKRIHEETRTPAEKFAETQAHLQSLLDKGAISGDDYARALLKAKEALEGLHRASQSAQEFGSGINLKYLSDLSGKSKGGARRGFTEADAARAAAENPFGRAVDPAAMRGGSSPLPPTNLFPFGNPFGGASATPAPFSSPIPNDEGAGIFGTPQGFTNPFAGNFGEGEPGSGLSAVTAPAPPDSSQVNADPSKAEMLRLIRMMQVDLQAMRQDWERNN